MSFMCHVCNGLGCGFCDVSRRVRENFDRQSVLSNTALSINNNIVIKNVEEGVKHDQGKNPLELLPTQALEEVSKVLEFGKEKYGAFNWAKGMEWGRLSGAALRHLFAWIRGEDTDKESGLPHLAHAGCCILFLIQYQLSSLGTDDRFKGFLQNEENRLGLSNRINNETKEASRGTTKK